LGIGDAQRSAAEAFPRQADWDVAAACVEVDSGIVPVFDALSDAMNAPAFPWYKRIIDGKSVLTQMGRSCTMPPEAAAVTASVVCWQFA
jgi:hypothetical protein